MGGKNLSKHARHLNRVDIEEQLRCLAGNECKFDYDSILDTSAKDDVEKVGKNTFSLYDFISSGLFTKTKQSSKRRSNSNYLISEVNQKYEAHVLSKKTDDEVERASKTCYEGHDFSEKDSIFLTKLQIDHPSLHISRLGKDVRASVKILCSNFKVAFFLIWNVDERNFDIQIIPIVNCSTLDENSLQLISNEVAEKLRSQFEEEVNDCGIAGIQRKEMFCTLSSFLVCRETDTTIQLSKELTILSNLKHDKIAPFEEIFKKSNINMERSFDYFDIFTLLKEDDAPSVSKIESSEAIDKNTCLICFDTFENDDIYLTTCGHKACGSCWKGLLRASSSSGDVSIRCPAYKCDQVLNTRDAAHLLFDKTNEINTKDVTVMMNLSRFQMDNLLIDHKAQHCSTPSCNRIFSITPRGIMDVDGGQKNKSDHICICNCGASICCKCGQSSHFGVTCKTSKRMRKEIATGRLDAELRSLLWLKKNTSPCPRCKFPINKIGGCNHMQCSKCRYSFCWVCGGEGYKCGSYRCYKTGVVTFGNEDDSPKYNSEDKMTHQVLAIQNYSASVTGLEDFYRRNAVGVLLTDRKLVHELQLRNMLLWTRGVALSKSFVGWKSSGQNTALYTTKVLELALDKVTKTPVERQIDSILNSVDVLVKPERRHYNRKKKHVSKPLMRSMRRQHETEVDMSLGDALQIAKIESMNEKQFNVHVSWVLEEGMKQLVSTGDNRTKHITTYESHVISPLNKKMKALKAPWKGEDRFDSPDVIVGDANSHLRSRIKKEAKAKVPWKGKTRVSARRSIALSLKNYSYNSIIS